MSAFEIIQEPCTLIKDPSGTPEYYHFPAGATLKPVLQDFAINLNGRKVATRHKSKTYEFSGKLVGEWENLSTLFPHQSANLGSRLVGNTDTPWRIITESGRQWTFYRAAITTRPAINAVPGETLLGEITLTAFYSSTSTGWFAYVGNGTHPGYSSFSASNILTLAPAVSFGSDPWDDLFPAAGAQIEPGWSLGDVMVNNQLVDKIITAQEWTGKVMPQSDATWAEWATKLGLDVANGAAIPVADLIVSYSGFYAKLLNAECSMESFRFAHDAPFQQGITARAVQRYSGGSAQALALISTAAP